MSKELGFAAVVSVSGSDEPDAAVLMFEVVPGDERPDPASSVLERCKAIEGIVGMVAAALDQLEISTRPTRPRQVSIKTAIGLARDVVRLLRDIVRCTDILTEIVRRSPIPLKTERSSVGARQIFGRTTKPTSTTSTDLSGPVRTSRRHRWCRNKHSSLGRRALS